jgi:aconitase B
MQTIKQMSDNIYQYLNFDQISEYQDAVGHIALDTILKE